jgi:hypothetical protein
LPIPILEEIEEKRAAREAIARRVASFVTHFRDAVQGQGRLFTEGLSGRLGTMAGTAWRAMRLDVGKYVANLFKNMREASLNVIIGRISAGAKDLLTAGVKMGVAWYQIDVIVSIAVDFVKYMMGYRMESEDGSSRPMTLADVFEPNKIKRAGIQGFMTGFAFGAIGRLVGVVAAGNTVGRFAEGFNSGYRAQQLAKVTLAARAGQSVGYVYNTMHRMSTFTRSAIIISSFTAGSVLLDYANGRITDWSDVGAVFRSAARGFLWGAIAAFATSSLGVATFGKARDVLAGWGAAKGGIDAMVKVSMEGAVSWMAVEPAFMVFGAMWEAAIDYALIVDTSGSMAGQPLVDLQNAARLESKGLGSRVFSYASNGDTFFRVRFSAVDRSQVATVTSPTLFIDGTLPVRAIGMSAEEMNRSAMNIPRSEESRVGKVC